MKPGSRSYMPTEKTDYKQLRKIDSEAARRAVLDFLNISHHNISRTASVFRISRSVVYDIITKEKEGDLGDRSRAPKHQPSRTPQAIQDMVIEVRNKTQLGPERLSRFLKEHEGLSIPAGTLRHIIRRNKEKADYHPFSYRARKEKGEPVD